MVQKVSYWPLAGLILALCGLISPMQRNDFVYLANPANNAHDSYMKVNFEKNDGSMKKTELSRKEFLKMSGLGLAGVTLASGFIPPSSCCPEA